MYTHNIYGQALTESVIPMKSSTSKIVLIVFASLALAIALGGALLLFFAMENEYDPAIHHFNFDAKFALYSTIACAGGFALAVAGIFTTSNKLVFAEKDKKITFIGIFSSVLAGLMCGLVFCVGVKGGIPEEKPGILLAELTFTVLSAVFFLLRAFGLFSKKPALSLFGLLPALMCAFMILNLYFNASEPLNAPLKIFEIVMLVSFMFYFTAEAGINILHPKMNKKYALAGIFAVASGGMVALSRLAVRIFDVDTFGFDIIRCVFGAVIWLCITVSFFEKVFLAREKEAGEAFFDSENEDGGEKDAEEADVEEAEADDADGKEEIPYAEPALEDEAPAEEAEGSAEDAEEPAEDSGADDAEEAADEEAPDNNDEEPVSGDVPDTDKTDD